MTTWHEFVQENNHIPEWPYPIHYGREIKINTDVLILGGGIAGCHAAINAKRKGVDVVVLEKGAVKWSGNGGAGVDHWLSACTNPCSQVSPEEFTERVMIDSGGYDCGPLRYINAKEGWDTLLDCEAMGVQIRDSHCEFVGADFRDQATGLMFAYDYKNKMDLRVYGHIMKPRLYQEMKRLGVKIVDRVMATSLLTEDTGKGRKIIGATGLHTRMGEFYIISSRATILATGLPGRIWLFSTENRPTFRDPNCTGEGVAAAWNAGAEFTRLEQTSPDSSTLSYIPYGTGNAHNTWHGSPIVDASGKEVPWVDREGKEFTSIKERFQPSSEQDYMVGQGLRIPVSYENHVRELTPDLPERIKNGEFQLPLYADLTRLPEHERRAIFGLMVGNEGKTRIPVYDTLTKAGFDPDQDMLQAPIMRPESYSHSNFWAGMNSPHGRQWGCGGLVVDWDLRTNLEGLYAAGGSIFGGGAHSSAAASGRYAGRKAASFARTVSDISVERTQIEAEKTRIYAPLKKKLMSIGWKELNAGICRLMQDHCGEYKTDAALTLGLDLLHGIRESEATAAHAANPHELARIVECLSIITVGEAVIHASLARKASSDILRFYRLDNKELNPLEEDNHILVKKVDDKVVISELPLDYHLQPPYKSTYEENYQHNSEM